MKNHKSRYITLAMLLLFNPLILASGRPARAESPPPPLPQPPNNLNFTAFVATVAAGVTIAVFSKGCEYCIELAFGDKEKRKLELQIQRDKVALSRMAFVHEFCKDDAYKDTCQQLKKMYLDAQVQKNRNEDR